MIDTVIGINIFVNDCRNCVPLGPKGDKGAQGVKGDKGQAFLYPTKGKSN